MMSTKTKAQTVRLEDEAMTLLNIYAKKTGVKKTWIASKAVLKFLKSGGKGG